MGVPQEHAQAPGPFQLVREEKAEGPHVGPHLRAQETASLGLSAIPGLDVQVVIQTLERAEIMEG